MALPESDEFRDNKSKEESEEPVQDRPELEVIDWIQDTLHTKHPEKKDDEVLLTNIYKELDATSKKDLEKIKAKFPSARIGDVAYDNQGNVSIYNSPVFVNKDEYTKVYNEAIARDKENKKLE